MPYKKIPLICAAAFLAWGCARDMASDSYSTSAPAGKVLEGTIISARAVKIKEHDKLSDNTLGGLGGGAAGAVGGASIGNGTGSIASGIGGAIVGVVAGAYIQDALSTTEGMEYLVKINPKNLRKADASHKKKVTEKIDGKMVSDMNASMDIDTQTDIVSVVQKADPDLREGSPVYVIYHDDRPRLALRKTNSN